MNETQITDWLRQQGDTLDKIIAEAAKKYETDNCHKYNFQYDLDQSQHESFNLIQKKDLCYDRPSTAFVYSMFYQARRINTYLKLFIDSIIKEKQPSIQIYDLGAGTGAVQLAIALLLEALHSLGGKGPQITIINVDSSPFMMRYNQDYLWPEFIQNYPNQNKLEVIYRVNSWNVPSNISSANTWVTASYLFDISDNANNVSEHFLHLINNYKPSQLILTTAKQEQKKVQIDHTIEVLKKHGYTHEIRGSNEFSYWKKPTEINKLRAYFGMKYNAYKLANESWWDDKEFYGVKLYKISLELDFNGAVPENIPNSIYIPKFTVFKKVELSEQQKKASVFYNRPSIVIGPAGSGKTIVLAQKIKNIVEAWNYNPDLRILVTTFNKALIQKIGDWISELLDNNRVVRHSYIGYNNKPELNCYFKFDKSEMPNIALMNFDAMPFKLNNILGQVLFEKDIYPILDLIIKDVKSNEKNIEEFEEILVPKFIYNEYHYVIYANGIDNLKDYLAIKRRGMWKPLKSKQREIIYKVVEKYIHHIEANKLNTLLSRRKKLLENLQSAPIPKFDYVLVDEFQDCTSVEYKIFFELIKDANQVTFAGDLAQSIHVGHSSSIPADQKVGQTQRFILEGSYRIPYRISEGLVPLSKEILKRFKNSAINQITPAKNSVPGARMLVVYAETPEKMAPKLKQIWDEYGIYELSEMSILEVDEDLTMELIRLDVNAMPYTILGQKGLEKECVVWSTRIPIGDTQKSYEFVYTILTRASNILIIALFEDTLVEYKRILGLLREDRLIMYDKDTMDVFSKFCEQIETEIPIEEENE